MAKGTIILPVIVHRLLRMLLRVAGEVRGAWRLRGLVTDVSRVRFPCRLIKTRLKFGQPLWIDPNDSMARYIFYFGLWESSVATNFFNHVRVNDIVLDVGANIGQYTVLAGTKTGPGGKVFSVEAHPGSVEVLRKNIEANCRANTTVLETAAWNEDTTLYLSPGNDETAGLASVRNTPRDSCSIQVQARRLDRLLEENGCGHVDIMKIDIEGAELPAMQGLKDIFDRKPPRLIYCEVAEEGRQTYGYEPKDLVDFLALYGYSASVFLHHDKGLMPYEPGETREEFSNMVLFAYDVCS